MTARRQKEVTVALVSLKRAELIRAMVDRAAGRLDPSRTDFVKTVGSLLNEEVT